MVYLIKNCKPTKLGKEDTIYKMVTSEWDDSIKHFEKNKNMMEDLFKDLSYDKKVIAFIAMLEEKNIPLNLLIRIFEKVVTFFMREIEKQKSQSNSV